MEVWGKGVLPGELSWPQGYLPEGTGPGKPKSYSG